jgi:hypothetical protein
LVALIIFGARWFIKSQSTDLKREELLSQISQELDRALETCENDKCRARKVNEIAEQFGSAELCEKLSGDSLTSCAWKVAKDQLDPEECVIISDKEKQGDCQDVVFRALASRDYDLSWCEKIQNEISRTRCVNGLSESIAIEKGCSGTGVDQSVCDRLDAVETAINTGNPNSCMALSDPGDQDDCLEGVGLMDVDRDGLSAIQEADLGTSDNNWDSDNDGLGDAAEVKTYKTDPTNPDTDGDGYKDGEEVKNGYNPLGSGKL